MATPADFTELFQPVEGKRVYFRGKDWRGNDCVGYGTITDIASNGTLIVRLGSDDFGGFGTYRRGQEIRVSPDEVIEKPV